MAAVIGDYVTDPSTHFHNMIANSSLPHQHQHSSHEPRYRSGSHSRDGTPRRTSASPRPRNTGSPAVASASRKRLSQDKETQESSGKELDSATTGAGSSRFPTPPSSASPSLASARVEPQNANGDTLMATQAHDAAQAGPKTALAPGAPISSPLRQQQQPSPESDNYTTATNTATADAASATPYEIADASSPRQHPQGQTIRIRDLAHIQSLAQADVLAGTGGGILNDTSSQAVKYEISAMPIGDIIEMVAALLTKITTTNDLQHDAMQRNVAHQQQANQSNESGNGSQMSPLSTSVLAFHGKNVPAITILSYLSRIHKYCPTTYDVFLSLLVYFDRMTDRVNKMVVKGEEGKKQAGANQAWSDSQTTLLAQPTAEVEMQDEESDDAESDSDLADDDDDDEMDDPPSKKQSRQPSESGGPVISALDPMPAGGPATYFVVDSFNIHRLIISGVTCASKFFSDVFYTNSRYAKVGGLPLAELNHLELQFLLLNDFRLAVPVEDLEGYATMLVEFYAREVAAPQTRSAPVDS